MRVIQVSKTHEQNLHNMGEALRIRKRLQEALKEVNEEAKVKAQESAERLMKELEKRYA